MVHRKDLEKFISELLDSASFDDYCINGLQVEGKSEINRIVTGVSASARLFREAASGRKADAVITHHGLFWKSSPHPFKLTGFMRARVKILLDNDVNFFGYHLPLDAHPVHGNNSLIAKRVGLQELKFVPIQGAVNPIAAVGVLAKTTTFKEITAELDSRLGVEGTGIDSGSGSIRKVFVLSGSGGGYFMDAVAAGADLMITGELREEAVRAAEESGLSLYAAGHYNSEKLGIQALGTKLAKEFDLEVSFIDIPNPV